MQEIIDTSDIISMDLDELKRTNRDFDVELDELEFPPMSHHMTVRAKLEELADRDVISYDDMQQVYDRWKENKQ